MRPKNHSIIEDVIIELKQKTDHSGRTRVYHAYEETEPQSHSSLSSNALVLPLNLSAATFN